MNVGVRPLEIHWRPETEVKGQGKGVGSRGHGLVYIRGRRQQSRKPTQKGNKRAPLSRDQGETEDAQDWVNILYVCMYWVGGPFKLLCPGLGQSRQRFG